MTCDRCGIEEAGDGMNKRVQRSGKQWCYSCAAKKQSRLGYKDDYCMAWYGLHDENDNPITSTKALYLPGARICGHRDCVRTAHIILEAGYQRPIVTRKERVKVSEPVQRTMEGSLKILEALEDSIANV